MINVHSDIWYCTWTVQKCWFEPPTSTDIDNLSRELFILFHSQISIISKGKRYYWKWWFIKDNLYPAETLQNEGNNTWSIELEKEKVFKIVSMNRKAWSAPGYDILLRGINGHAPLTMKATPVNFRVAFSQKQHFVPFPLHFLPLTVVSGLLQYSKRISVLLLWQKSWLCIDVYHIGNKSFSDYCYDFLYLFWEVGV